LNFVALIPNNQDPASFNEFRNVPLFSLDYKLVFKTVVNRLKVILSSAISEEQFKFLSNNQIRNAMGTAKELMHSIKTQKLPTAVTKLHLARAYDKVNWLFIR